MMLVTQETHYLFSSDSHRTDRVLLARIQYAGHEENYCLLLPDKLRKTTRQKQSELTLSLLSTWLDGE